MGKAKSTGLRVGIGYDAHRMVKGRSLILGGVKIPHPQGLFGHSDADVLVHAICDSLLGGISEGDIGKRFPDSDPQYKDIESLVLLQKVAVLLEDKGFRIVNIDTTIVAQAPRLGPYLHQMESRIAETLNLDKQAVNVKATTTEGMGFTGRGEGVAAYAVALVEVR